MATEVDHIIPHKGDMKLFWDSDNWQGLCKSCHSKKTAKEQRDNNGHTGTEVRVEAGSI
jgi:5-methylcytosine-specific restriction protein A